MPLRDWICSAHGVFESSDAAPKCKFGCNTIQPIFLRAPAVRTNGRTSNIDRTLQTLAADFGLSDMSTKNGSVMNSIPNHSKPAHIAASYNNLYSDQRTMNLTPRFAPIGEAQSMFDGSAANAALAMKDKSGSGLGDTLHNRMGRSNVDKLLTQVVGETSQDDNAKLSHVIEGSKAA